MDLIWTQNLMAGHILRYMPFNSEKSKVFRFAKKKKKKKKKQWQVAFCDSAFAATLTGNGSCATENTSRYLHSEIRSYLDNSANLLSYQQNV